MRRIFILTLCVFVLCCGGCANSPAGNSNSEYSDTQSNSNGNENVTYEMTLKNDNGSTLSNVKVFVYADKEMTDLFWVGNTDKAGKISFTGLDNSEYTLKFESVPAGCVAEDNYTINKTENEIVLATTSVTINDISSYAPIVGTKFPNLSVTDVNGNEYTVKGILSEKKALVLNFWFISCGPCRNEFPYLQEAYTMYSDTLEVLAIDFVDNNASAVIDYVDEMGLTMPAASVDSVWGEKLSIYACPTTVIIDRYGTVVYNHSGAITDTAVFTDLFAQYTADDYNPTAN